jgi:uncharacterized protein YbaA (DUF1428 family)
MAYIDGIVTSAADREAYLAYAERANAVFKQVGATRVVDGWGSDVPRGERTDLYRAVDAADGETVVFGWIEWPDKAARDAGWARVMAENLMPQGEAPFDMKKMIFGGFEIITDQ